MAFMEIWIPAQHDTEEQWILAQLNALADLLARKGAAAAGHYLVPYPALWQGIALAKLNGALVLSPRHGLQTAYDAAVQARYEQKFGRLDPRWRALHYGQAFLSGSLTLVSLQRVSHLAVAAIQPYPATVGARPCPYCHSSVDPLQPHLHGGCAHAEVILSLAETTVLEHEAWGPQTVAREFLQCGVVRDQVKKRIYGFSATGRLPLLAQCPPPQWAVQILSATAQWFEMGDRQHPHRIRSSDKAEIVRAYLDAQGQQMSAGL